MNTYEIALSGDITTLRAGPVKQQIACALADREITELVLDMSHVGYMDSAGLSAMIWACRRMQERHGVLRLRSVQPAVKAVLDRSNLASLQRVVDERSRAATGIIRESNQA